METSNNRGSDPSRAREKGRRKARRTPLPEQVSIAVPRGWRRRIEEAARIEERPVADWLRECLRRGFDLARKRGAK